VIKYITLIIIAIVLIGGSFIVLGNIESGYKVDVQGDVTYNLLTGWGCNVKRTEVNPDSILSFYWFWETKDVIVVGEMGKYEAEAGIGTLSSIAGGKDFSLLFRNVESGSYTGTVKVYEVEKGLFGTETTRRVFKCQDSFTVVVK